MVSKVIKTKAICLFARVIISYFLRISDNTHSFIRNKLKNTYLNGHYRIKMNESALFPIAHKDLNIFTFTSSISIIKKMKL